MTANWDRTQAAMLALMGQMSQLHERNPGAGFVDVEREVGKAMTVARRDFRKGPLLKLAAASLYAWIVLEEDGS